MIAERISELTGIPERTVRENLDETFKQPQEKVANTASLGLGEQVRVPGSLIVHLCQLPEYAMLVLAFRSQAWTAGHSSAS
jgi:hypothetical protein